MAKKRALQMGLQELLSDIDSVYEKAGNIETKQIYTLEIDTIISNPMQPRQEFDEKNLQELAHSIQLHGLLQPIIVRENEKNNNQYILVAGERRLRALKLLNATNIEAIIIDVEMHKMRELALIENIQRQNLNPIELAQSYKALIQEHDLTQEQLAERLHKSRTQLTNTLRLLELSQTTQNLIKENKITQGHAKVLVGLSLKDEEIAVQTILGQKINVRETENLVKHLKNKKKSILSNSSQNNINHKDSNTMLRNDTSLQDSLEKLQRLLQQYNISSSVKNNGICLVFKSNDDVQTLLTRLKNI
ncbi:chromosome partitioning protein ParB [Helicobacter didelphidarum]|uniref:Chromosome partitioning protein ParB n=1 Tax=Helicobacter didelphidarum TaxID=2040648 RepID=A0A3D8IE22_9HELI|nr:ParB/RepB/Spo0J family partition protein [Helicobacter didelphidarum]RDU63447.1 chromosome partitioning protein ParB [Helicobacter didelphidarum]